MKSVVEKPGFKVSGFIALVTHAVFLAGIVGTIVKLAQYADTRANPPALLIVALIGSLLMFIVWIRGYFTVEPNSSKTLIFFGAYAGTVRDSGFWWTNPFTLRRRVSLRVRNFVSEQLKVNDLGGNPIEIAAVVVWRVTDVSRALFDVDDYDQFVEIQTETALRSLASRFPYDTHEHDEMSLRGSQEEVSASLKEQLEERLQVAGVDIVDSRISHLAYAPEIAQAMLRRQQAQAIIAARSQIVEGAVGMVKMALKHLSDDNIVELDEERKATMVNNLLVVLTSEQPSQPVLNAGSLY